MPSEKPSQISAFGQAKSLLTKEFKTRKKVEDESGVFKDVVAQKLNRAQLNTDKYFKQLNYPSKNVDKAAFVGSYKACLTKTLLDNKVTKKEYKTFIAGLESQTNLLKQKMIRGQLEQEKVQFNAMTVEVAGLQKATKFNEANIKLQAYKKKKAAYYSALQGRVADSTFYRKFGAELKNLEIKTKEEQIRNVEYRSFLTGVLKVYSQPSKRGREIIGMKGPNYISAKDDNGTIVLSEAVLNKQSGKLEMKKSRRVNWVTLMSEIKKNNHGMKEVRVVEIPRTDPPQYKKQVGDYTVGHPQAVKARVNLEEKKMLNKLNEMYSFRAFENLKGEDRKMMATALKENMAKWSMYLYPIVANGRVKRLMPTNEFKSLSIAERRRIYTQMVMGVKQILQRLDIKKRLKENKEKSPAMRAFFEGGLAMNKGLYFKAYNRFSTFLHKIQSEKTNIPDKEKMIQNAKMQIKIASLKLVDTAERYLIAASGSETWSSYAKKEYKILKKVRDLIISGAAKDFHSALRKVPRPALKKKLSGGRLSSLAGRSAYLSGSPILDSFANLTGESTDAGFKAALLKIARKIRKKGMLVKAEGGDTVVTKGGPSRKNILFYDHPSEGMPRAAAVLFKVLMRKEIGEARIKMQLTPENIDSRHRVKTPWKTVNKLMMKKPKESYHYKLSQAQDALKAKRGKGGFDKSAQKIAYKFVGGKAKFNKLSKEQQVALVSRYKDMLYKGAVKDFEEKLVFNEHIKKGGGTAAKEYRDMMGIEKWDLSDKQVKEAIDTTAMFAVDAITLLAPSYAAARLTSAGLKYAGQRLITRLAAKKALNTTASRGLSLAVSAGAYTGGEIVMFHTAHSALVSQIKGVKGMFKWNNYWKGLKHSAAFLVPMHVGGKIISPRLAKLSQTYKGIPVEQLTKLQRMWQKLKPRLASVTAFEAPAMSALNGMMDSSGKPFLKHYIESLQAIAQFELGTKLFNSATGNIVPKSAAKLEMRAKVYELKASANKVDHTRAEILDGMMKEGAISVEAMGTFAHLKPEQMRRLQDYITDNASVQIALKLIAQGREIPKEIQPVYNTLIGNMKRMGLNKAQAEQFLKSLSIENLIPLQKKAIERTKEFFANRGKELASNTKAAKTYLISNASRIKKYLSNPRIKKAFVAFIKMCDGQYSRFKKKFPKLAPFLPKDLRQLGMLSLSVVAATTGIPIALGTVVAVQSAHEYFFQNKRFQVRHNNGEIRLLEVTHMDPHTDSMTVWDYTAQTHAQVKISEIYKLHGSFLHEAQQAQQLALRLERIGMKKDAAYIADFSTNATLAQRKHTTETLEQMHHKLTEATGMMKKCGYTEKEIDHIADYNNQTYVNYNDRLVAATEAVNAVARLQKMGLQFRLKDGFALLKLFDSNSLEGAAVRKLALEYRDALARQDNPNIKRFYDALKKKFRKIKGLEGQQTAILMITSRLPRTAETPHEMLTRMQDFANETQLRAREEYTDSLNNAVEALRNQSGVVQLHKDIPTLMIPDLHGDRAALVKVLSKKGSDGRTNLELLQSGELQMVVMGDGMHVEGRAADRWRKVQTESWDNESKAMHLLNPEMVESLGTMKMIMDLKAKFPDYFHYLKGNHDNITNRNEGGDRAFKKYEAHIGGLVKTWVKINYGDAFLQQWAKFEQSLPILAVGNNFAASHSEPGAFLAIHEKEAKISLNDIANRTPEAIDALTWSRHDEQGNQADKVMRMAGIDSQTGNYFVGHTHTHEQPGGYEVLPNRVTRVNDANDFKYIRVEANGHFSPETHVRSANAPERVSVVVQPQSMTPVDRTQYRAAQRDYVNQRLNSSNSTTSVENPQGSISVKVGDKTIFVIKNGNDFWLYNPNPDVPGANQYIKLNDSGYIRVGREYQKGWFTDAGSGTVSRHHVDISRIGDNINFFSVTQSHTDVVENAPSK